MRHWYAAQTQPRKERLALTHLGRQSFTAQCPFVRRPRRVGGRVQNALEPLFPGYVFVSLDCEQERWRSVDGTIGIRRLVAFGSRPAPLADGFIEQLSRLGDDAELSFAADLQQGDRVRVIGGAFDKLCGTLLSVDARRRVTVLMELLSGEIRVTLPRGRLLAA
ncbi:transcription/translation regulatory transformer protein RfaH [Altererythrobacter sp. SALINAS58]|uniref:transcription termination/antitermination protein NusG n=1 Tax=Alteripontixanthobacter muriae TaxID=2705546 RepID=UPI001575B266|nr:transcription termination/antitermination NusG family protein [Alteripontixanthobacter muriae]NTZ43837.1 transcription/translation regulatory transformer protein RfaH [Alteripontixanthobacter muriae]